MSMQCGVQIGVGSLFMFQITVLLAGCIFRSILGGTFPVRKRSILSFDDPRQATSFLEKITNRSILSQEYTSQCFCPLWPWVSSCQKVEWGKKIIRVKKHIPRAIDTR
jgi:hypothetical protein